MYFLNTEMHMVTFLITMFEIVMLAFQAIYLLERPGDRSRLQYLVLLVFLIAYNVCGGLFPDPRWLISIELQTILAYLVGFTMSMYVVYYFYKVFELQHLKFFATYGLVLFLFLPFLFLFIVPFLLTHDVLLSSRLTVIIPFLYGLGFIYYTARALKRKFSEHKNEGKAFEDPLYEHAIAAYISMVCWAALPVIVFFGDFQVLEHSVTNAGFLMMTIIYVRSAITQSRKEYQKLLDSEKNLQQLNNDLRKKVKLRTRKLEQIMEERKTTFINLAHETKTPLTLINNYLDDYIQKNRNTEEINIIKKNIGRLTADIVNFFDVESYEKGFSMYNHEQVSNFSVLLNAKLALFQAFAKKKQLNFQSSVEEGICIKAHPGAIDRIVNNILDNAIKYSSHNGCVYVAVTREGAKVKFSVKDTGSGIPEQLHERVFDPYYKLSVHAKNSEGMGMGLSIVKRIVDDLNGQIVLQSAAGNGTEVNVLLPLYQGAAISSQELSINAGDVEFAVNQVLLQESLDKEGKPFILIVEDNPEMTNFLIQKLKTDYNVAIAANGREALGRMEKLNALDLIISDVMMDEVDGFDFCKSVFDMDRYAHIPFIFLTAKGGPADRLKGLGLGAIDYIQKPFKIEELQIKIESILSNLKKHRAAVVSKAYNSMLLDNGLPASRTVTAKRCVFTDNCRRYHLTSREIEIIKWLIKGLPYKVIGDKLNISNKTVAKHISNIFSKVGVGNKIELINRLDSQELSNSNPD
jgi:signal transduction histidine kinase/DNA-binding NarL/FixJ family response regulator